MDEHLIFSEQTVSGGHRTAVEALTGIDRKALTFDDSLAPQLDGARVLAPVMVFKEGDYVSLRRNGKAVPFKADKARMERWLKNTLRDSAVNYDHKRTEGPNDTGWLRVATGNSYLAPDPRDGKLALWAQPELGPEALDHVQRGRYRDLSIEIDPETESIVGLALTNYPKVKTITQFSEGEHMPEDITPAVTEVTPAAPAVPANAPTLPTLDEFNELKDMLDKVQKQLADTEAARQAEIDAANARAEEARLQARRAEFSDWVSTTLIKDGDGLSAVPVGAKDQVVELLMFADSAEAELMLFSDVEGTEPARPLDALKAFLSLLPKVQAIGESAPAGLAPEAPPAEGSGLLDHVKATKGRAKRG